MDVLWFNGRFTTTDERVVGVEDRGFQFSDGIYEVLKFRRRAPLLFARHFERLVRCLELLEIPNPWSANDLAALFRELLERTAFDDGIIYLQVTRGECARAHAWPDGLQPTALVYTRRFAFPTAESKRSGLATITTPEIRWRLCDIKSINLLPNVLAKKRGARAGAGEVLFVDDGVVTEGASSAIFGVKDGLLITHPQTNAVLPATVRDCVLELAAEAGFRIDWRPLRSSELSGLDEAFLASTTQAVMPVASIDGKAVGSGSRGPVTESLQRAFDAVEEQEIEHWLATR